jgi:hypothetical protein
MSGRPQMLPSPPLRESKDLRGGRMNAANLTQTTRRLTNLLPLD